MGPLSQEAVPRRSLSGGLRWLLLPWHAARVLTGEKSFRHNPLLGSEWLNRRGLHLWRVRLAQCLAEHRRRRLAPQVSSQDRADFAQDGFVQVRDFLPATAFEALAARLAGLEAEAREMREGGATTRRIAVTPSLLRRAPELAALLQHPRWRGLTRYVASFDAEPTVFIQIILADGPAAAEDPQTRLHMDTFHPTMKAWFFLHAVEEAEGPLTYVPGSHIQTPRRQAWQRRRSIQAARARQNGGAFRVTEAELSRFGFGAQRRFAVPGNTLVVADTCGFHARGASSRASLRVEIYATSRPNPFYPLLRPVLDWVPVLGRRRMAMQYWLQDRLAPLGLARMTWRRAGPVPAAPVTGMPKTGPG
jgi:hypothetical protein